MSIDELIVEGPRPLRGRLRVPGDKSISHRALLLAGVAEGHSALWGLGSGDDVARTRAVIEALGVRVRRSGAGEVRVHGAGWGGLREPEVVLDCGNSGTAVRLLAGLLSGRPFLSVLTGDASVAARPMGRVVEPLRSMGASIDGRDAGEHVPLTIRGGELKGIRHEMPVASAQVKSALILAGLQAEGPTEVVEPVATRDHTERMLRWLGVRVDDVGRGVSVQASPVPGFELHVPGDPSSAAFFVVGALVTPGSELVVEDVAVNPRRVAFVEVLHRMGGDLEVVPTGERGGEPVGEIRARTSDLRGTVVDGQEIALVIDEIPALAVAAAFAEGVTEIRDAGELRVKESDRIGAIEQELAQMHVAVDARRDSLAIRGGRPRAARLKSHGDHRIAMAGAIAANAVTGESVIQGSRAVNTSYPEFGEHLERLARAT